MGGRLGSAGLLSPSSSAGQVSLLACPKNETEMKQLCPWVPLPNPGLVASTIKPHPGGRG